MTEGRACTGCGARVTSSGARYCDYCGAELPAPPPRSAGDGSGPSLPEEALADRFRALERHPDLPELMLRCPSSTSQYLAMGFLILFGTVFGGIGLAVFLGMRRTFSAPGLFRLFPLIFVAIGAGIVLVSLLKIVRFSGSMLERPLARIAGERTRVSGGGNDQAARTSYYVTLESPDGFRTELEATAKVAGAVSEGDFGVAYVRDRYLLDFARLRV